MSKDDHGSGDALPASRQLAAVDLGSNSFRLEIGQIVEGRYRRIDYLKETVRLGAGLGDDGMLGGEAVERGLACLRRFATRLAGFDDSQVRAVATQTLREAKNRNAFLVRAQEALGRSIDVIAGREEARLIYAGVARLQPSSRRRLVVDIGGRSTELITGTGLKPRRAESFAIGSVSLSMRYFPGLRFSAKAFAQAETAAGAQLEEATRQFASGEWEEALGSSGTVGAVSQLLAANGITDGAVTPLGVRWLIEQCIAAGSADALALAGLKEERRAVLGGGLAILAALASEFRIASLLPARGALRQGVIFELAARAHEIDGAGDLRDESVHALMERFGVDAEHADRVAALAARLYASAVRKAPAEQAQELRWAALLHEIGKSVSAHDFHRHGAYVVGHADVAGFSQGQLARIGELVLAHRGGLKKVEPLLGERPRAAAVLALRLAVIVCHGRDGCDDDVAALRVANGADAVVSVDAAWATGHPRAVHLLQAEAELWKRSGGPSLSVEVDDAAAAAAAAAA